jgi:hypothetical protein
VKKRADTVVIEVQPLTRHGKPHRAFRPLELPCTVKPTATGGEYYSTHELVWSPLTVKRAYVYAIRLTFFGGLTSVVTEGFPRDVRQGEQLVLRWNDRPVLDFANMTP